MGSTAGNEVVERRLQRKHNTPEADECITRLSEYSQEVLARLAPYSDCIVKASDGVEVAVQSCFLTEHSRVVGYAATLCASQLLSRQLIVVAKFSLAQSDVSAAHGKSQCAPWLLPQHCGTSAFTPACASVSVPVPVPVTASPFALFSGPHNAESPCLQVQSHLFT